MNLNLGFVVIAAAGLAPASLAQNQSALSIPAGLGHIAQSEANIWVRAARPGSYRLTLLDAAGAKLRELPARIDESTDLCSTFLLDGLTADTAYAYRIELIGSPWKPGEGSFRTRKPAATPQRISIGFGSCAGDPLDKPLPVYTQILAQKPDAFCLIGDTPYIDTTELAAQRDKYRQFFAGPELAALRHATPTYGVWDDHDFGLNDTDGRLKDKANSRRAFAEYHANAMLGQKNQGIYNSFRLGGLEVFLVDARWFSCTEPSFVDAAWPTLIGQQQWTWLTEALKASDAPFKAVVTGMIWNDGVRPAKRDFWGYYDHERGALWKHIQDQKIGGVVMVGGDIHRSRLVRHDPARTGVSYPLYEFISSPLGSGVHTNAEVPVAGLEFDAGEPRSFMLLAADTTATPPRLDAVWMNQEGKILHRVSITADQLVAK